MRHRLVRLLGRSVKRNLRVGLVGLDKGQLFIGAIDRSCGRHHQVRDFDAARGLHDIEGSDDVGLDIGARIFKAVAHACLRGEMDDDLGITGVNRSVEGLLILEHRLDA